MSILDIKSDSKKYTCKKTVGIYFIFSIFAFVVNKVYALFGHGVSSDAMTWMFLYPLAGGVLFYLLLGILLPEANRFNGYRLFYNLYNSGIALLTMGSLLKGILEIAGTKSAFTRFYYMSGYAFIAVGLLVLILLVANYSKLKKIKQ